MINTIIMVWLSALLGFGNTESPAADCNCTSGEANPVILCNRKFAKCKLIRKKFTYLFELKGSKIRNRYKLEVNKSGRKTSYVAYSGRIYVIDKRREGKYVIKIPISINKSYSWDDNTRTDFLVVEYNINDKDFIIRADGNMPAFEDTGHGYNNEQILREMKQIANRQPLSPVNAAKAASAYFILNYTKAMKD